MRVVECGGAQVLRSWEIKVESLAQLNKAMAQLESEYCDCQVFYGQGEIVIDWD